MRIEKKLSIVISTVLISSLISSGWSSTYYMRTDRWYLVGTTPLQPAYATNTIENHTSSSNLNCNPSSSCSTTATQSGTIGSGDGNLIDQDILQENRQCTGSGAFCNLIGDQRGSIGESSNGVIIDTGTNNVNSQSNTDDGRSASENTIGQQKTQKNEQCQQVATCQTTDVSVTSIGKRSTSDILNFANDNTNIEKARAESSSNHDLVSQIDEQNNKLCLGFSICTNSILDNLGVGGIQNGAILNLNGGNNFITQNTTDSNSANGNNAIFTRSQENNKCTTFCSNDFTAIQHLGEIDSNGAVLTFGNGNTISQDLRQADSGNDNILSQNSDQKNDNCRGNFFLCNNAGSTFDIVGGASGGVIFESGNNNTDNQKLLQAKSNNHNSITDNTLQSNNCQDGQTFCDNHSFQTTSIGNPNNIGTITNDKNNNRNIQTLLINESNNGNIVSNSGEQKSDCIKSDCTNNVFTISLIGSPSPSGLIENHGINNKISQNYVAANSNNNNKLDQKTNQDNKNCEQQTSCLNTLDSEVRVGSAGNGIIVNNGDNNTISDGITTVNSNNNNNLVQQAAQFNHACSNGTVCANIASVNANIGSEHPKDLTNDQNNANITQSTLTSNTNNHNSILQNMGQNNLCTTGSGCENFGNLTATISGENNAKIDQSISQNNLCVKNSTCANDGKVIAGSGVNKQSNLCVEGATCNNTGTNNKNTCVNGAICNNTGGDTKVISSGDTCNSGVDGSTTICTHGRILIISQEPNLIP